MRLVRDLRPKVVVIANSYVTYLTGEQPADLILGDSEEEVPSDLLRNSHVLLDALESRVREIVAGGSKAIILEEVPFAVMPATNTEDEMWAHNRLRKIVNEELHRRFEGSNKVEIVDASEELCGSSPTCALDRIGTLQYWHKTHLNRYGSLRLVPFWSRILSEVLPR
jgi:hypothetical protein